MGLLLPQQWVAAANMTTRRNGDILVRPITTRGYVLSLPDGTLLAYRDGTGPRVFRSIDQAERAYLDFAVPGNPARFVDLPAS